MKHEVITENQELYRSLRSKAGRCAPQHKFQDPSFKFQVSNQPARATPRIWFFAISPAGMKKNACSATAYCGTGEVA